MTRAASKRAAAQQEEDHLATVASEAVITQVSTLPDPPEDGWQADTPPEGPAALTIDDLREHGFRSSKQNRSDYHFYPYR